MRAFRKIGLDVLDLQGIFIMAPLDRERAPFRRRILRLAEAPWVPSFRGNLSRLSLP